MQDFRYLDNTAILRLADELCIGCGNCEQVCPHRIFRVQDGKAVITDKDGCMECGACAKNCPAEAISVEAGVGCAQAIFNSWRTGKTDCGCEGSCCG